MTKPVGESNFREFCLFTLSRKNKVSMRELGGREIEWRGMCVNSMHFLSNLSDYTSMGFLSNLWD